MLSPYRLFLWGLVAGLLLTSGVTAQESKAPPQQRRQLWDAFSFVSLRKCATIVNPWHAHIECAFHEKLF